MPCVLARTSSVGAVARPSRELATTPRAEARANIPPRKRGRSWGRGHRRSQAPSPLRPEAPTRADPAQAFVQHLQDAGARAAGPAASAPSDAIGALFPNAALSPPSTTNLPLHLKREYTAALNTLALFCPASVSTVDLGGNDWQAPARPHVVTSSSLSDLVEAARLSVPTTATEPGVVTAHDASVVRKLGFGSCNLPEPHPVQPAAHPTPNTPANTPRRRLPPTHATAHPSSPTLRTRPTAAARLRCGAYPATSAAAPAASSHAPLAAPAAPRPATPLRSAAPTPPSAARLRNLTHSAPLPGLGGRRPSSPARAPACPTAPRTAAVCGPRRRVIRDAISSSMRGLLAPAVATAASHDLAPSLSLALSPPAALDATTLCHSSAHPTPADAPAADGATAATVPLATQQPALCAAAQLVAEHLGLGGQVLSAGDHARLGAVLESFEALAGAGFVPRHLGPRQYSSWLVRRSAGLAAGVWHAAAQCALAPLVE